MHITKNKQIVINIISSLIAFVVNLIINFFLSPYIVKNLGEEVNGFVQLANNFIMYASLITVALNSMAGRFISISYHKKDYDSANKYYSSLIIGNLIIILLLIVPSIFCIYKLETFLKISPKNIQDIKLLFLFVFINFFVTQIIGILNIATYVTNKLYLTNMIGILRSFLNLVLLGLLFSLFTAKIYFIGLVGLILSIVTMIFSYIIKIKIFNSIEFKMNNFNIKSMFEMIAAGIWNTITQCGNILLTGLDLLMANILIDPIQMGLLSVAKIVPNSIIQLATIINSNFSPSLVITYATKGKKEILKDLRSSMKISSVLISIPVITFCVFGYEFYNLWMPTLNSKKLLILSILTCLAFIPFSGPQVLYNVYTTTNKLKLNSITVVLGGILNFIIVFILLKKTNMGVYAIAGVSSIISIIRNLVITVPYTAIILNLRWYEFYKDILISIMCCTICLIISNVIRIVIIPKGWSMLIISVFIACVISFIINIVFVLNKNEKLILKNKFFKGVRKNG